MQGVTLETQNADIYDDRRGVVVNIGVLDFRRGNAFGAVCQIESVALPRRCLCGHDDAQAVQASNTSSAVSEPEQQIIIVAPAAFSASDSTKSR